MKFSKNQTVILPVKKIIGRIATIDITQDDKVVYYVLGDDGSTQWLPGEQIQEIPSPDAKTTRRTTASKSRKPKPDMPNRKAKR